MFFRNEIVDIDIFFPPERASIACSFGKVCPFIRERIQPFVRKRRKDAASGKILEIGTLIAL